MGREKSAVYVLRFDWNSLKLFSAAEIKGKLGSYAVWLLWHSKATNQGDYYFIENDSLSAFRLRHESFCFRIELVACFRRFSVVFGEAGRVERTPHPEAIKTSP